MWQYSNIDNEEENTPAENNSTVTSQAEPLSNLNESSKSAQQENGNAFNSFDASDDDETQNSESSAQDHTDRSIRISVGDFSGLVDDSNSLDDDIDIDAESVGRDSNIDEQINDANDRDEDPTGEIEVDENMGAYDLIQFTYLL